MYPEYSTYIKYILKFRCDWNFFNENYSIKCQKKGGGGFRQAEYSTILIKFIMKHLPKWALSYNKNIKIEASDQRLCVDIE